MALYLDSQFISNLGFFFNGLGLYLASTETFGLYGWLVRQRTKFEILKKDALVSFALVGIMSIITYVFFDATGRSNREDIKKIHDDASRKMGFSGVIKIYLAIFFTGITYRILDLILKPLEWLSKISTLKNLGVYSMFFGIILHFIASII
jgi:hypothetical protein